MLEGETMDIYFDNVKAFKKAYPNAAALWDISSSKFTSEDSQKYIKENASRWCRPEDVEK